MHSAQPAGGVTVFRRRAGAGASDASRRCAALEAVPSHATGMPNCFAPSPRKSLRHAGAKSQATHTRDVSVDGLQAHRHADNRPPSSSYIVTASEFESRYYSFWFVRPSRPADSVYRSAKEFFTEAYIDRHRHHFATHHKEPPHL